MTMFQATIAAEILYVISLGLAKMVVLQFLLCLAGSKARHKSTMAVMALNAALTVAAILAVGFQCEGSSMVLFSDRCFDQASPRMS